jgi:hypothetical protein
MKLELTGNTTTAIASRQPRCTCCGGVIETSTDQDMSLGLSISLGLVSDECALICNSCTAQLISANAANTPPTRRR